MREVLKYILFCSICIVAFCAFPHSAAATDDVIFDWAKSMRGTGTDLAYFITLDSNDNVYTTGYFEGTVDFDPGAGTSNLTSTGGRDIFISKLDSSGNFVWAKQMGGSGNDLGKAISFDLEDNLYITGAFSATADFDPGEELQELTPIGSNDVFIVKLGSNGNFLWAKNVGSTGDDLGNSVALDSNGNIYITGYFGNATNDFDPGAGTSQLDYVGSQDFFLLKLDSSGDFIWAKSTGNTSQDLGASVKIVDDYIYITGGFKGSVDFDFSASTYELTSLINYDVFVLKLNLDSGFIFVKQFGGSSWEYGNMIDVDSYGNIYVIGMYAGTTDFDPGEGTYEVSAGASSSGFFIKLNSSGDFVSAEWLGGDLAGSCYGLDVDSFDNVYVIGRFTGTSSDFDPGIETNQVTSNGVSDFFIRVLDSSGDFLWAKSVGGTGADYGLSIALDSDNNIITTGYFEGTVDFDPGTGTSNLTSAGDKDIFILKLIPQWPPTDINISSQSVASNSSAGTPVGTFSALDRNENATFTYTLSSGDGCTATDNEKFSLEGTTLKIMETTNYYTKNTYDICVEVTDNGGLTYRKNFEILVPSPSNIEVATSSVGTSDLPDVPEIILDGEKVVDLANGVAETNTAGTAVSINNEVVDLENYTVDGVSGVNVKSTSGITVKKATKINTAQENLVIKNADVPTAELQIPKNTVVFGGPTADFQIEPPRERAITVVTETSLPVGKKTKKVVSVGSSTDSYVFDKIVTLVFQELYTGVMMRRNGSVTWATLAPCGGTFTSPTNPGFPNACWIADTTLGQTKIITYHLTDFAGLEENPTSGKGMFLQRGMKREDVPQSSYGTDKRTFPAAYEKSLADVAKYNKGIQGKTEYMTTSWGNEKFLKYEPGRTDVEQQLNPLRKHVVYRGTKRDSGIVLVAKYLAQGLHASAAWETLQQKKEVIESFLKGIKSAQEQPIQGVGYRRESTVEQITRMKEQQKAMADAEANEKEARLFATPPVATTLQSGLHIQEPTEKTNIRRSSVIYRKPGVLQYLQSSLLDISTALKTSLFEVANFLKTSLFFLP